ncbi:protein Pry1p [[Candida] jaroonii]|uniref:Protein Pry1p n=1 Tax=[Candida] jaroonii TaxID=467808 RepID=A0ACA9Y5H2_9ASCO|nr:protein Pry1p [[Candida] jaroonii]
MKFFSLSVYLSILAVSEAAVKIVTEVKIETVYANGVASSYSSEYSSESSYSSEVYNSTSSDVSYSVDVPTYSEYVPTTTAVILPASTSVPVYTPTSSPTTSTPTTTSIYTPPTSTPTTSTPTTSSTTQKPTTLVSKTSSSAPAATGGSISGGVDKSFAKAILDAHNEKRAEHSAPALEWDDELYQYAANYASSYSCSGSLSHSGGKYGENLAVGYANGPAAVQAWYDEGKNYDYSSASSFDHFTQVIWKSTTKLGCAYKDCSSNNWGKYIICSYDPAGNMIGSGKSNLFE